MTSIAIPQKEGGSGFRLLGWGASALLHGGALAFLIYGLPHSVPQPAGPEIIPLEMAAAPPMPAMEATEATPAMEQVQAVSPDAAVATAEPPPVAVTSPEPVAAVEPPPPEAVTAEPPPDLAPPEVVQSVQPQEVQQAVAPDEVPLEVADIPPPPPAPPPPPPVRAAAPKLSPAPLRRTAPAAPSPSPSPAPAQASSAPAVPAPSSAQPAPRAAPRMVGGVTSNYTDRLSAALERAKRHVMGTTVRRNRNDVVMLYFRMRRDGALLAWRITQSSGDAVLDRAAGELIQRAALPPLPADMPGDVLELVVPIRFNR
ncbi:TonB family protein [Roseomonas marmotae]|uniref:TonB family protein n=1 Tax=Roseomonas marmotae TaxID=2768161 RepID=A0ABS3KCY1_9PROT|nr:TonB family protein [Roseomonas marmotae]MBO1075322.1 TonB family protein [Roseomonas marmotae]QTI78299.1 TonB family protein [Roseomonas marmotae]